MQTANGETVSRPLQTATLSSLSDPNRPYLGRARCPHRAAIVIQRNFRLNMIIPRYVLNRFSRTPQPQTAAPPPLKHRSTGPPHAPEVGQPSSRSFDPTTAAKE